MMDPYRDVIPGEDVEEVRKKVRERDCSNSEEPIPKRARANTNAYLPQDGEDEMEKPPEPEETLELYDHDRLQRGLNHICQAARRKITPRTEEFLKLHKDAYKKALDAESTDVPTRAVVQAMDKVYYSAVFILRPQSEQEYKKYMAYTDLRQRELLFNYGDYLGQGLQEIRADLKVAATQGSYKTKQAALHLGAPNSWLDISDVLDGTNPEELDKHVYSACIVLGLDYQHMKWLIQQWGNRNRLVHIQIREKIKDCKWASVAQQISLDLKELLKLGLKEDVRKNYEKVLVRIRNKYFTVIDVDDFESWIPSTKATELSQQKQKAKEKEKRKSSQSSHRDGEARGIASEDP